MALRVVNLSMGLVNVMVGLVSAVEAEDTGLHIVCRHDGTKHAETAPSRIKRKDVCPVCETEGPFPARGKEVEGGLVVLDTNAMQALVPTEDQRRTMPLTVHPRDELARAFPTGKSYYLEPRKGQEDRYALMAALLEQTPELGYLGEFAYQSVTSLYEIVSVDGVLRMRQLARPEAVKATPAVSGTFSEKHLAMAKQFAAIEAVPYDPAAYRDKRAETLAKMVADSTPTVPTGPGLAPVVDIGTMLEAALAAKGVVPGTSAKPAAKTAAKKATARRTAKKAAAVAS